MELVPDLHAQLAEHWRGLRSEAREVYREAQGKAKQWVKDTAWARELLRSADEARAHLRWSRQSLLQLPGTRVPFPYTWDLRHQLALADLLLVLRAHSPATGILDELPPVTTALLAAQLVVFLWPGGLLVRDVSLSPFCVVDQGQVHRVVTSAFVHLDAAHLMTNLAAALPECLYLEAQPRGSFALAADLVLLTLLSHGLYVYLAWVQKAALVRRSHYYTVTAVGFSGVVFALKVFTGCRRRGTTRVLGIPTPSQFSWLPALALSHLCVPEASFPAHACGVAAGLLRFYALQPVLDLAAHCWRTRPRRALHGQPDSTGPPSAAQQPRAPAPQSTGEGGAGPANGACHAVPTPVPSEAATAPQAVWSLRRRALGAAVRDITIHVLLLGGCTAVYLALSSRKPVQQRPASTWWRS